MIRVRIIEHDGHMMMDIHGHGPEKVCALVSFCFQAAAQGMSMLMRTYPKHVGVAHSADTPEENRADQRRRARRGR